MICPGPQLVIQRLKFSPDQLLGEQGSSSTLLWPWPASSAANGRMTNLEQAWPQAFAPARTGQEGQASQAGVGREEGLPTLSRCPQRHTNALRDLADLGHASGTQKSQPSGIIHAPGFQPRWGPSALHLGYTAHLRASRRLGDFRGEKKMF